MKKNLFGTDGIRGRVGTHPFTLDALPELGKALGLWLQKTYGPKARVLIAHDTRLSCSWVKTSLASGILMYPLELVDAQVLPTPAVACLIRDTTNNFSCGIVISASHNPYHDNGIKIMDARTGKISHLDEMAITELFYADSKHTLSHETSNSTHISTSATHYGTIATMHDAETQYLRTVVGLFPENFLQGKKIVLDCANGATSFIAPKIFELCGADVITINNQPNGLNINEACGALHPEGLQQAVLHHKAHAGFAFDGDGDRVIVVDSAGQVKNGDDILALLSEHPRYKNQSVLVGTVMSNQGFEQFLHERGKSLIRTAVGDKYVAQELEIKNVLLGGEQSGHIIIRDYLSTGDGIVAALHVLESILLTHNVMMKTFIQYPQVLLNVPVPHKKDLTLSPFREIIEKSQAQLSTGRILVRYSGTESLLRIMAEAESLDSARRTVSTLSEQLLQALSQ